MFSLKPLKKAVVISLLGHLAVFSAFNFSFGGKLPQISYPRVCFWGAVFNTSGFANHYVYNPISLKALFAKRSALPSADKISLAIGYYLKPPAPCITSEKASFKENLTSLPPGLRKESVIMFYPQLPRHFLVYFKDRQTVHMEIIFKVISSGRTNSILIKRKISSGNLEVDLLSMRYISRYLFEQQNVFAPNSWQTVKIDLQPQKQ